MKKLIFLFLIPSVLLGMVLSPVMKVQAGSNLSSWHVLNIQGSTLSAPIREQLSTLQADQTITVIVQLRQKANLPLDKGLKRTEQLSRVIEALSFTANKTQGPVKKFLDDRKSQGRVEKYTAFWIFNGFSVTATRSVIDELALQPDVLSITPDELDIVPASTLFDLSNPGPNLNLINAPSLWSMGYTGQGVVVASMDSGVSMAHADLSSRWRGGSNSWYDPYGQHPASPTDMSGHGTWTMGVMVGSDAGGTSIGVAPGAQWIAVKMFNDAGSSTATAIHQGYQWLLNPDGNPATADAPNIINNSWTFAYPGCYLDFEPDLQALRTAGILPVFAAGNGGPSANTSYSPANNPSALAVGAINNNSGIYGLSSRGPTSCGGSTGVFPELVAPGVNINTTDLGGFYTTASGTSISAPHVAGGLALLLSAYPNLSVSQQEDALRYSAFDLGIAGPDDIYGYGRVNLLAAYQWLAPAFTPTPAGALTNWNNTFDWTGVTSATWYLVQVQTTNNATILQKWYTADAVGCSSDLSCTVAPEETLSLANGDYKWRILDYGGYGYGSWSVYTDFNLNAACHTLVTDVLPAGSGTINATAQNCSGGYISGTVVQLTATPKSGYAFTNWSGDAAGISNPVTVTMDGNKSVTANLTSLGATLISPAGALTSWNNTFSWTGITGASWYLLQVQTSSDAVVLQKWYTVDAVGCSGDLSCAVLPDETLNLSNSDYKWRIIDYGEYGYGSWTPFTNFNLNAACYTLTTEVLPVDSGTINTSAQNCSGGYISGTVVQMTATPNSGYTFTNWSGDASGISNPVVITMDGNKNVSANLMGLGATLISPAGVLASWNNTFNWTGVTGATWYLVQIQTPGETVMLQKWYTAESASCLGDLSCSASPDETMNLTNGDYKWRILDYGGYGYGSWTPYTNFNLNAACYSLTANVSPSGSGTIITTAQNCNGGYLSGTVVQLTAIPNSGYSFTNWSGDANGALNPVSITIDANKNVTANLTGLGVILSTPLGTLTSWNNTFTWTGLSTATWYLVQVQTSNDTVILQQWYTADATGCLGGTACLVIPPETANLPNGDYKWHILDYGAYGYGNWSPYTTFTLTR